MTNEEIKEVLDAFDLGKQIEEYGEQEKYWFKFLGEKEVMIRLISRGVEYRVKPEPEKVELYGRFNLGNSVLDFTEDIWVESDTHKLSYLLDENGEPICDSIKLEKL